ncbi:MAG TPA: VTT domain-containing protein [Chloroflexota bacterium]|nr:VTT domain-containing protein [Chloroflexota bacterium]
MGHELSVLLTEYGLPALFLLALIKALGVPLPVPADLVALAAAGASAGGKFVIWQAFVVLLVAMVGGGTVQYLVARGLGRNILYRHGYRLGLTPARLDAAFRRVVRVNALGIAVAVVTPGVRTAAIPASGIAAIPMPRFVLGLFLGTTGFLVFHFTVGYTVVKLLLRESGPEFALVLLVLALAVTAAFVLFSRRGQLRSTADASSGRPRLGLFSSSSTAPASRAVAATIRPPATGPELTRSFRSDADPLASTTVNAESPVERGGPLPSPRSERNP